MLDRAPVRFSQRFDAASDISNVGTMSATTVDSNAMVMRLLSMDVPLSLLFDLLDPCGPGSAEIYAVEAARETALQR